MYYTNQYSHKLYDRFSLNTTNKIPNLTNPTLRTPLNKVKLSKFENGTGISSNNWWAFISQKQKQTFDIRANVNLITIRANINLINRLVNHTLTPEKTHLFFFFYQKIRGTKVCDWALQNPQIISHIYWKKKEKMGKRRHGKSTS